MISKSERLQFDLYPVTCEKLSQGRSNLEVLDGLIAGGARIVQLRDKDLSDGEYYQLARAFRERTSNANVTLIVNDRVDVALAVNADGVHLGQGDFPVAQARKLLGHERIIGLSTHNIDEAKEGIRLGADYINVGPIYPTQTKDHVGPAVGIGLLRDVLAFARIPVTVMGGIKLDNLDPLIQAGASRIAVVTGLVGAQDIPAAVREFRRRIQAGRGVFPSV